MPRRRRLHNISRYVHHSFRGWTVTLKRRGRRLDRYFKDGPSRDAALARAIRWRDMMIARLPPPRRFKTRWLQNKTGVIGVHRAIDRTRAGTLVPRYAAVWTDEHGKSHKRSFSVLKYGDAKARALAVDARKRALAEMLRPRRER